jgi:acetylornithine deacetylase/succinyl-diaminopimelate desuccinylase-like protein
MPHPNDLLSTARLSDLAQALVAIRSVTGEEQRIADFVHGFLRDLGLETRRLPVEEAGDSVVGWLPGAATGPTLMLNFHLDTFDIFDGWETDPLTPTLADGRLYGLGSHDMKGGGACVLGAVEAIVRSGAQLGGRLLVSATSDEENWSRGAHALIHSGLLEGCIGALVPEPSAVGTLTIGQRGRHVFRLRFAGRTIHAAFGRGINAVADAARVAALLHDPATVDLGWSEAFQLSGSLCVIGLHGGGTMILVPERAELFIDRHILPGESAEHAAAQIRAVVERAGIESRWELDWDDRPTPAPGAFVVPPESRLVQVVREQLAREQGREIQLVLGRSVADTNHFAVHGGVPTLICGPQGGNTCEANEYLEVGSLLPTARAIAGSVVELLGGLS